MVLRILIGVLILAALPAFAQTPERVRHIDDIGQLTYQRYLARKNNRAFVLSETGGYGEGNGWSKIDDAINSAMQKCRALEPQGTCKVYSLNGQVVWGLSQDEAIRRIGSAPAAAGGVPYLRSDGQRAYENYKLTAFHRAFYISEGGGYGSGFNANTLESAQRIAKQNCEKRDPTGACKPYAISGYTVWGQDADKLPRYAEAPTLGYFVPNDYTPVQGPQKAKGVVIWSHGYKRGIDNTASQPHGYVSRFLADGWDIYRFNREWATVSVDLPHMVNSIAAAKAAGYAKVVLVGQSQGAWLSLGALGRGATVDGVIATAPANHGDPPSREARQDFRQLIRDVASGNNANVPVVVSFFEKDAFDPGGRFADVQDVLGGTSIPFKLIDRPKGFEGHHSGDEPRFNDLYGRCLFSFTTRAATAAEDCK